MGGWFSSSVNEEDNVQYNGEDTSDNECEPQMSLEQANFLGNHYHNESELFDKIMAEKIQINKQNEKESKKILGDFLKKILEELRTIDLFRNICKKEPYYTGSYYEGLRVKEATEFDINLQLEFPFDSYSRKFEYSKIRSFIKYKLENPNLNYNNSAENDLRDTIKKTFFEDDYLIGEKVKRWMQSILAKIQYRICNIENVKKIIFSQSGPAKTFKLITYHGYTIDIDLVPVVKFNYPEWPAGADKSLAERFNVPYDRQFWFLVPKEYADNDVSPKDRRRLWRVHFPEIEKAIICNRGCVKPIIKMLKLLRDKQQWKVLASYYLKTVVVWLFIENPNPHHWSKQFVWERFVEVLTRLQDCVEERKIPYLFYKEFNLLGNKMNVCESLNISSYLRRIIKNIDSDVESIENYI